MKKQQIIILIIAVVLIITVYAKKPVEVSSGTCFDYIMNQGETGVDCNGPCFNKCGSVPVGGFCVDNVECQTNRCDHQDFVCMNIPVEMGGK